MAQTSMDRIGTGGHDPAIRAGVLCTVPNWLGAGRLLVGRPWRLNDVVASPPARLVAAGVATAF
jgi:hypothetical protein